METTTKASFLLGEEWLYYKIYTGFATADDVLINHLHTVITGLLQDRMIDKWFFIRYTDPEHHIRLRLHLTQCENIGMVILAFQKTFRQLFDQHMIWKLQNETYNRELNRYGDQLIKQAEDIFFYDSEGIVKLLTVLELTDDENEKWIAGMGSVDMLLDAFQYSIHDKKELMENLRSGFFKEFRVNTFTKKELSAKYRNHKNEMERFMKADSATNELKKILEERNLKMEILANDILQQLATEKKKRDDLLASYIHMSMNRLFDSNNRQCEMVLYDLLCSYYTALIARKKKEETSVLQAENNNR